MNHYELLSKTGAALQTIAEKGALLIAGTDKPNAMTIGWAMASIMWTRNVFVAPVRHSRYTHALLEAHKEFTIFVPYGDMKKTLGVCGSKSGRDTDKIALCGIKLAPSQKVQVPHVDAHGLVIECRVIYQDDLKNDLLADDVRSLYYSGRDTGNLHTLYYGEIIAQYEI